MYICVCVVSNKTEDIDRYVLDIVFLLHIPEMELKVLSSNNSQQTEILVITPQLELIRTYSKEQVLFSPQQYSGN